MKTEEDEAFDDLAKRQGSWGGGFKAKQAMAADKLQEPDALTIAYQSGYYEGKKAALAQPVQEPVARVSGVYGGRFVYDPINPAIVLPIGMALYAGPA